LSLAERAAAEPVWPLGCSACSSDGAIDALTLPAILILHDNKACVLLGREGEQHLGGADA
jgi:hypothetical protein